MTVKCKTKCTTDSYLEPFFAKLESMPEAKRIEAINSVRMRLHELSPFSQEPVDCVIWVPADQVHGNAYNPNSVAPPEMKLLEHSVISDGFTQPIVAWKDGESFEVVDGFHRNRVGKECPEVRERVKGYLPITIIRADRLDKSDRVASTIRHNRARGKHKVEAMSDIVIELKRRNWSDDRICREQGRDREGVLRLSQITGLADLFQDQEFSKSWDVEGEVNESDFEELTDDISTYGEEATKFRTVNTSDEGRVFHTYEKWECYAAGFYNSSKEGMNKTECEEAYREFLADLPRFADALGHVITEWKHSCEHYLTNVAMNKIAWLGQAAMCYATGVPTNFRSGFSLLDKEQRTAADEMALVYLNKWNVANGRPEVTMAEAYSYDRQSDIY